MMSQEGQVQNREKHARARLYIILFGVLILAGMALPAARQTSAATAPKAYVGLFKDNAVAVIDTGTNTVIKTIPVPTGPHGIVITPDGLNVYVSSDGDSKVSVIDTASDAITATIEVGKTPHGLAITKDGSQVLVAGFGTGMVSFIDTATNKVTGQVAVTNPHNIALSPDGKLAYIASQAKDATALVIINMADKTQAGTVSLPKPPRALNFSPDGKQLYFTEAGIDAVEVLDPTTNKITTEVAVGASPHHPLFTSNGEYGLVVSQTPNELDILDPATNTVKSKVSVGKMPHWIAVTADNETAYVTDEASNEVSVVNIDTSKVTTTISVGQAPRKIVIQPMPATPAAEGTKSAS